MPEVIEAAAATSVASAGVAAEVTAAPATEDKTEEPMLTPVEQLFQAIKMGADADAIVAKLTVPNPRELVQSRDAQGHTTAHWAAKRGEPWLLRLLLDKGASVSAASEDDVGMRPLHWACTEGRMACARLLVDRGADVNARDKQGCTPLVVAAQWGQADAAAYLIKVGADFRIFDRHDDSALHWAAYKGNVEIVGLLHHLGLPLDDADGYGQTPLHLASLRGNLGVCEYLLVDAVTTTKTRLDPIDKNQKRPVDLATEKGHRHIVQFLNRQRPVCERGVKAFVQDNMSLGACIRMCIAGEKARFPWCACGVVRAPSRGPQAPRPALLRIIRDAMFAQVRHGLQQAARVLHLLLFVLKCGVFSGQRQRRGDAPVRHSRGALCMNQFTAPSPLAPDLLVDLCTGMGPRGGL